MYSAGYHPSRDVHNSKHNFRIEYIIIHFGRQGAHCCHTVMCSPISVMTSYFDLIDIMTLYRLDRLTQCPRHSVLVIRMLIAVFMKYDAGPVRRITRAMQIPIMAGVFGLDRHVIRIRHYYFKVPRVDFPKLFRREHAHHLALGSATI